MHPLAAHRPLLHSLVMAIALLPAAAVMADIDAGREVYRKHCQACHQPGGEGIRGAFPPLLNNPNIKDKPDHIARSIIDGKSGTLTVNGETYHGFMPAMAQLTDENIAAVIHFILAEWNENPTTYSTDQVKSLR